MEKIITHDELYRIAEHSKLELNDTNIGALVKDLENMIEFVEKISEADVSVSQKETSRLFLISELRDDSPTPSLSREKALAGAPTRTDSYITVPTVIEE